MITIASIEYLWWRNRFADHPVCVAALKPGRGTGWRFETLPEALRAPIVEAFPPLRGRDADITLPELMAALCQYMQQAKFDRPAASGSGDAQFWFTSPDRHFASTVVMHTATFVSRLIERPPSGESEMVALLEEFEDACEAVALDQSVRAIAAEADRRGIPWFRIALNMRDIQLGYGFRQQRMRETIPGNESHLAISYSRDKTITCRVLAAAGLPVGRFGVANNPKQAASIASSMGFPVVVKPTMGGKGVDVCIGLASAAEVQAQAAKLFSKWQQLTIQSFLPGDDHRLLVVNGRLIAAAKREPASVTGDGRHTIEQLIEIENRDSRRGRKFHRIMNLILIDDELHRLLREQKLALSDIPSKGVRVRLRRAANISRGGTATDVTGIIHPDNALAAERAAAALGLKVAGVDFLIPDISRSWREAGGGICEVNACPGPRAHWLSAPERDVIGPILDTVIPPGSDARIPVALITGSGADATARILGQMLREAGHVAGSATPEDVAINGAVIADDAASRTGTDGCALLMRDPFITAAAIALAAEDVERSGIYFDRCHSAALLDANRETAARKVLETAHDHIIVNADDAGCLALARHFPKKQTVMIAGTLDNDAVHAHLAAKGLAVMPEGRKGIAIRSGKKILTEIPVKYQKDILPALAAIALAHGMGVSPEAMAAALARLSHGKGGEAAA